MQNAECRIQNENGWASMHPASGSAQFTSTPSRLRLFAKRIVIALSADFEVEYDGAYLIIDDS